MITICYLLGGYTVVVLKELLSYACSVLNHLRQKLVCSAID